MFHFMSSRYVELTMRQSIGDSWSFTFVTSTVGNRTLVSFWSIHRHHRCVSAAVRGYGREISFQMFVVLIFRLMLVNFLQLNATPRGVASGTTVRALVLGCFGQKNGKIYLKNTAKKWIKIKNCKGVMLWATDVCPWAAFLLLSLGRFLRSHWVGFSRLG